MIDRLPREGEVLILKTPRLYTKDRIYKITNVRDGYVALNEEGTGRGNKDYSTAYFDNNGINSHGEWCFYVDEERYKRHLCGCGSSYIVPPGETPPGKCEECLSK